MSTLRTKKTTWSLRCLAMSSSPAPTIAFRSHSSRLPSYTQTRSVSHMSRHHKCHSSMCIQLIFSRIGSHNVNLKYLFVVQGVAICTWSNVVEFSYKIEKSPCKLCENSNKMSVNIKCIYILRSLVRELDPGKTGIATSESGHHRVDWEEYGRCSELWHNHQPCSYKLGMELKKKKKEFGKNIHETT